MINFTTSDLQPTTPEPEKMSSDTFMNNVSTATANFAKMFPKKEAPVANATQYSNGFSTIDDISALPTTTIKDTPTQYSSIISQKASQYGLPASLLSALIKHESNFNTQAANDQTPNREQSYGLGQINLNAHPDVTKAQAEDPNYSVDWVAKRLKTMVDKYGLYKGIQAYNTPGAIGSSQLQNYANTVLSLAGYTPKKSINDMYPGLGNTAKANQQDTAKVNQKFANLGVKTTEFGDSTRYEKFHPGIDIANKIGTAIPAFVGGIITKVVTGKKHGDKGYGNYVVVTDANGSKHQYSHLSAPEVKVGQKVGTGQEIGKLGDTGSTYSPSGNGTGAHLDYRISSAYNKYINPYTYLSKTT